LPSLGCSAETVTSPDATMVLSVLWTVQGCDTTDLHHFFIHWPGTVVLSFLSLQPFIVLVGDLQHWKVSQPGRAPPSPGS